MKETPRENILEIAIYSPSAHNTQPRVFDIKDDTVLDVYYDPSRLLPIEDSLGRFMTATMGMLIECIEIASNECGYTCDVDFPETLMLYQAIESPTPRYFCTVKRTFSGKKIDNTFTSSDVLGRRTSRFSFDQSSIDESFLQSLQSSTKDPSFNTYFSTDEKIINKVLDLNAETIFEDLRIKETRDEIGSWSRYSKSSAYKHRDGLWAKCMNIGGLLMNLFFNYNWLFNLKITYPFAKKIVLKNSGGVSTISRIISNFKTPKDRLQSGRDFMRFRLTCHQQGIYVHPFGSIITNENTNMELRNIIDLHGKDPENLWLIVRLGRSEMPERSLRIPLHDKLLGK